MTDLRSTLHRFHAKRFCATLGIALLLCACSGTRKQVSTPKIKNESRLEVKDARLYDQGIDFIARQSGNDQAWELTISKFDSINFNSISGIQLFTGSKVEYPSDRSIIYRGFGQGLKPVVTIGDETCENGEYKVEVDVAGKKYYGCGKYLFSNDLNGKWVLGAIGNKAIGSSDYKGGLPYLQFDLRKRQVRGSDGCNKFFGGFATRGSSIRFFDQSITRKRCAGTAFANKFKNQINNKIVDYRIKDGKLIVSLIDDSVLTFNKTN